MDLKILFLAVLIVGIVSIVLKIINQKTGKGPK